MATQTERYRTSAQVLRQANQLRVKSTPAAKKVHTNFTRRQHLAARQTGSRSVDTPSQRAYQRVNCKSASETHRTQILPRIAQRFPE